MNKKIDTQSVTKTVTTTDTTTITKINKGSMAITKTVTTHQTTTVEKNGDTITKTISKTQTTVIEKNACPAPSLDSELSAPSVPIVLNMESNQNIFQKRETPHSAKNFQIIATPINNPITPHRIGVIDNCQLRLSN